MYLYMRVAMEQYNKRTVYWYAILYILTANYTYIFMSGCDHMRYANLLRDRYRIC